MKRFIVFPVQCALVVVLALVLATPRALFAQDHVVSPSQIQQALVARAATRRQNQEQVERFLSTAEARQALKNAHIDYEQVNRAIPQLSGSELAMLAQRTAKAQRDFAAGSIAGAALLLIVLAVAVLILVVVLAR